MRIKRKATTRTMIPLEWDKRTGLREWRLYIRQSVVENSTAQERTLLEAQRILVKEARYTPTPYLVSRSTTPQVHNERIDRIVYLALFIAALIASAIWK